MKQIQFILVTLLSYYLINPLINVEHDELYTIAEAVERNNYEIREWHIYGRKPIGEFNTKKEFYQVVTKVKRNYENYSWEFNEDPDHHIKVVGTYTDKEGQFSHRIILTAVINGKYQVEIANEVKGEKWSPKNVKEVLTDINYPPDQTTSFYIIKGEITKSNILNEELFGKARILMDDLSATKIESVADDHFVSVSGLTDKWDNKLTMKDNKEMNLQIALRFNPTDNKINLTLGAPIITTEY